MNVPIAWSRKELTWLSALLTLPGHEFLMALDDIASMSGRTVNAVASKARQLRQDTKIPGPSRRAVVATRSLPCPQRAPIAPIKQLTPAQMMVGRAR